MTRFLVTFSALTLGIPAAALAAKANCRAGAAGETCRQLADLARAVQGEVALQRANHARQQAAINHATARIAELEARLAAVEADAGRHREAELVARLERLEMRPAEPQGCGPGMAPVCEPSGPAAPPVEGDKLLTCFCADGARPRSCVETTCAMEERVELCASMCAEHGGYDPENIASCFADTPECGEAPPPPPPPPPPANDAKLLTCYCSDGARPQSCVETTCAAEERMDYCDVFCAEHGGYDREHPGSCFADHPQCAADSSKP